MFQKHKPPPATQARSIYSLALWGCVVALLSVVVSGAVVVLAPNARTFGQPELPSPPGSIRTREEGDAIERRARENLRQAEEYIRSGASKRELRSSFARTFGISAPLLVLLTWLLLRIRRPADAVTIAVPALLVGALIFGT
jgi:hypothetical protein